MTCDILLVIPLLLLLLLNNKRIERFENETCDITDRKIKLLEEKMKIETIQAKNIPNRELTERINKLDEKISELNKQISKQSEEKKEKKEKKESEEDEVYSGLINWNTLNENHLINGIMVVAIVFLTSIVLYLFFTSMFTSGKKDQLKLEKMNLKYDSILDEIKKSKVKDSLKIKKGSFFDFLK
jgi:hypothetical protein